MKTQLLRCQRLFQPTRQGIKRNTYIQRSFSTSNDNISKPHKTAFAVQSSQKPRGPSNTKYEYPKEREIQLESAFNFCISELQKDEPQIYDTLQYLKCKDDHERLAIIVLRVLHLELSKTRTDANTSDAARIRLKWWKSAISELINEKSPLQPMKEST